LTLFAARFGPDFFRLTPLADLVVEVCLVPLDVGLEDVAMNGRTIVSPWREEIFNFRLGAPLEVGWEDLRGMTGLGVMDSFRLATLALRLEAREGVGVQSAFSWGYTADAFRFAWRFAARAGFFEEGAFLRLTPLDGGIEALRLGGLDGGSGVESKAASNNCSCAASRRSRAAAARDTGSGTPLVRGAEESSLAISSLVAWRMQAPMWFIVQFFPFAPVVAVIIPLLLLTFLQQC